MKKLSASGGDALLVAQLAAAISIASFFYYLRHGDLLLYGDAVAHINIARRVFDSKTPGLLQLGTVWLPLPHLLMVPFLLSSEMWRGGAGGSIPSMAAYVISVIGIFRLVRGGLSRDRAWDGAGRITAWGAAIVYGANPNLIYMQSTAMTEVLYLALFIWAMVDFSEFACGDRKALTKCGLCVVAACLTRYDGWLLAAVMAAAAIAIAARNFEDQRLRRTVAKFVALAAAGPLLWLALAGMGLLAVRADWKRLWPTLLLAVPIPFYALSLAYGGVPIFVPTWWPFSYYNVRYGLQLLPAMVVFGALGCLFLIEIVKSSQSLRAKSSRWMIRSIAFAMLAWVTASYIGIWQAQPICYREAATNSRGRQALEKQVAVWLKSLPPNSTILMYLGEHVGAIEQAGVPLRSVIHEGNHRVWQQPVDREGLWERALADPGGLADYVVAFEGDPVWKGFERRHLPELVEIETTGQPR